MASKVAKNALGLWVPEILPADVRAQLLVAENLRERSEMFSALSSYAMRVCAQLKCVNSAMFDRLRDAKKVSASNASEQEEFGVTDFRQLRDLFA